jgi:hypothetical protein
MLRTTLTIAALLALPLVAPSRAATTAVKPDISFEPQLWFYMLSSEYDHQGILSYLAIKGAYPAKVPPATGYMTCDGGYSVPLLVTAGPWVKGRIRDRFDVLPQSVAPPVPIKTILKCSSTWGLYSSTGTLLDTTTLYSTIVYNTGDPAIAFAPSAVTLTAGGAPYAGRLDYFFTAANVKPIPDPGGYLTCSNGASVPLHVASGPIVGEQIRDSYTIDPGAVSLARGTSISCSSTWGSYLASGSLLGQATLSVTITGS